MPSVRKQQCDDQGSHREECPCTAPTVHRTAGMLLRPRPHGARKPKSWGASSHASEDGPVATTGSRSLCCLRCHAAWKSMQPVPSGHCDDGSCGWQHFSRSTTTAAFSLSLGSFVLTGDETGTVRDSCDLMSSLSGHIAVSSFVCALSDLRFICVTAFMTQEKPLSEFHPSW